jgi:hypothetical protein
MKCGFFDVEKGVMVEVEEWESSRELGAVTAASLKALWMSGKHRLPSPYWCLWDDDRVSVFPLLPGFPDQGLLDRASVAMKFQA